MFRFPQNRLAQAALVLAAAAMLLLGFWILTTRETHAPTVIMTELDEGQITERALDIAANDYQGEPTDIRSTKTTMGELDVISCNPVGAWVSRIYDRLQDELDWCNPNTPVWVVELRGDFQQGTRVTHSLSIVLDGVGKFIRLGSGSLVLQPELD